MPHHKWTKKINPDKFVNTALDDGRGILRLAPTWVPREIWVPGGRIKLHPNDYYAFGTHRGGIDERWLASTVKADNGPLTTRDEGLSYIITRDGEERLLLKNAIELRGKDIIGERLMKKYGDWPAFAKFFDNKGRLPIHIHQNEEFAARIGQKAKPESYYYPPQMNQHEGDFPYSYLGFKPGTVKDDMIQCLKKWKEGDNGIRALSVAYKLEFNTGWNVPAGVLHGPGSLCTYEPQKASDVFAFLDSMVDGHPIKWDLLVRNVPDELKNDYDYIISMIDWEANLDPDFVRKNFTLPLPVRSLTHMEKEGYVENWVSYRNNDFSAKELSVLPGREVTIKDNACYGFVLIQGYGICDQWRIETPTLIRFGELTNDEFFVTEKAAREGVKITNSSVTEPLVILKHFGPDNPDLPTEP